MCAACQLAYYAALVRSCTSAAAQPHHVRREQLPSVTFNGSQMFGKADSAQLSMHAPCAARLVPCTMHAVVLLAVGLVLDVV